MAKADVCQSGTELAVENEALISADEFHTDNRSLDNAIADAVMTFGQSQQTLLDERTETLEKRLVHAANEQRRLVGIAIQAFSAIRTGRIGVAGATGTLLVHTLSELQNLADRILPEIR